MASTDAVPRLIRQFTSLFLITPRGDVWRVFDSNEPTCSSRIPPADDPSVVARLFIGSGKDPAIRIYRFGADEARAISAERLYEQLTSAPAA
jgi:hypothetical protein